MTILLFASIYLIPAFIIALVFWALWRLVQSTDLSLVKRRTLFIIIGTLGFAPMIVPAGIIFVAWAPHGLLLLTPNIDYYVRFSSYVIPSFIITGIVFSVISYWAVKAVQENLALNRKTFILPITIFILCISLIILLFNLYLYIINLLLFYNKKIN